MEIGTIIFISFATTIIVLCLIGLLFYHRTRKEQHEEEAEQKEAYEKRVCDAVNNLAEYDYQFTKFKYACESKFTEIIKRVCALEDESKIEKSNRIIINDNVYKENKRLKEIEKFIFNHKFDKEIINSNFIGLKKEVNELKEQIAQLKSVKNVSNQKPR